LVNLKKMFTRRIGTAFSQQIASVPTRVGPLSEIGGLLHRLSGPTTISSSFPLVNASSRTNIHSFLFAGDVQRRSFYIPRKNWFPWRLRQIRNRQRKEREKRNLRPKELPEGIEADEFNGGPTLKFKETDIHLSLRRLIEYGRWIKRRHLLDAIDRVECLGRPSARPIVKLLKEAREKCIKANLDPQRLYVDTTRSGRGHYVKTIRYHARGKFGIQKSPRNVFIVFVREMPKHEFFHKLYILGKVPKCMASDMRLALRDRTVSPQMEHVWAPYLSASSRFRHRQELKWRQITRKFDYYEERRKWIEQYDANNQRRQVEERLARGLPEQPTS